jgi:hypothetical protein
MRETSAASLILDDFGRDERTRTADPLLAKHARPYAVTCAFARCRGLTAEAMAIDGAERPDRSLGRYTSGTP